MENKEVIFERAGHVATLTVNRPKQLNALNTAVLEGLKAEIEEIAKLARAGDLRAVVVTGAGEKAFVAGADIAEMRGMNAEQARAFGELGHGVMDALAALPLPVIAQVGGYALGGGLELALACDLIFASTRARFGQPEVNLGIIPGFGGTQRLARRIGPGIAKQICMTGEPIDAEEALRIGLVNRVVPPEELGRCVQQVVETLAKKGPLAVAKVKQAIDEGLSLTLAGGLALERSLFADLFDSADRIEGMEAFLQKRPASFKGK